MENRRYIGSITKYKELGEGSFSKVYLADYFDSCVAYKEFLCGENILKRIQPNIEKLTQIYDSDFILPQQLIYEKRTDELFKGYTMDYLCGYNKLNELKELDYNKKIELLKRARILIDKFHNKYNMLHGDICPWNILYNKQYDTLELIDFDLSIDLNNKENALYDDLNEVAAYYAKYVGVDKDLDMFLFNLTTYSFLNNKGYLNSFDEIVDNNNYGCIENSKAIEIFECFKDIESGKVLKKEYVIDYL